MARICEKWFPKGSLKHQTKDGFYMDDVLKAQLDILITNAIEDWDFTIIISGGGEVRVGKSVLAMQIAAYWAYELKYRHNIIVPFSVDNFIFEWEKLIKIGHEFGNKTKHCPLIYDEAGETLEGSKALTGETKQVLNFLRECGQYNFLNILVMPEFFELPKRIALTRSKFLIDVYYTADKTGKFGRGYFRFYSQRQKKKLYLRGKKEMNYFAAPYNFQGRFYNNYPISEEEYRRKKNESFIRREVSKLSKDKMQRNMFILLAHFVWGWSGLKIEEITTKLGYKLGKTQIYDILSENKEEFPKKLSEIPLPLSK